MLDIIKYSWHLFTKHFLTLLFLAIPFWLLLISFHFVEEKIWPPFEMPFYIVYLSNLITYTIYLLYLTSLILFLNQSINNNIEHIKEIIYKSLTFMQKILILSFALVVFQASIMLFVMKYYFMTHMTLMVISIYIAIKLTFMFPLIVLEGNNLIESIVNSFKFTKGHAIKIVSTYIVHFVPFFVFAYIIKSTASATLVNIKLVNLGINISFNLLFILVQIVIFNIYYSNYYQRTNTIES